MASPGRPVRCPSCRAVKALQQGWEPAVDGRLVEVTYRVCVNAECSTRRDGGLGDPRVIQTRPPMRLLRRKGT